MEANFTFTNEEIRESQMGPVPFINTQVRDHAKMVDIVLGCIISCSNNFDINGIGIVKIKGKPFVTRVQIHGSVVAIIVGGTEYDLTKDWSTTKRGSVHKLINDLKGRGTSRFFMEGFAEGVTIKVKRARNLSVASAVSTLCKWNIANPELNISLLSGGGGTVRVGVGTVMGRQSQRDFNEDMLVDHISKSPEIIKKECELEGLNVSISKIQDRANLLMNEIRDLKNG